MAFLAGCPAIRENYLAGKNREKSGKFVKKNIINQGILYVNFLKGLCSLDENGKGPE